MLPISKAEWVFFRALTSWATLALMIAAIIALGAR